MKPVQRGIELIVRPERAEALLWSRLRFERRDEAREPLFNRYAAFARAIAARLKPWGPSSSRSDAEQWAYSGLLEAIDTFDPLHGAPFPAFARPRIAGSVRDGFARSGELEAQWNTRRRAESERLRSLAHKEVAGPADAIETLGAIAAGLAIGLMLEGTRILGDEESADPAPNPYDSLEWREMQKLLEREVGRLSPSEASVIRQHYANGLAFSKIAAMMGLSRGRISQLHSSALAKLRKRLSREY